MTKNFIFVSKGIVMSQTFSAILFLSFFSLMATAQNIVFTDAQFEAKLLEASVTNGIALDENNNSIIIDTNNDGIIQESEVLPVIKLNVSDSAITSLNGIEFFQNLTELNCTMNHLTTLILPELPNLTFLECRLNQLEVLDLSLTENLMTLTADLNNLHTIVFHPNAQLNYINLGYNNLVALDVSGLSQLSDLLIHHNSLELLNVTGLVNLNSLNCRDNHLTALDLSGLSGLAIAFCQNNQLTNIELNGLNNLTGLECQDNQLVQMDVSDSPILEYVFVENNNLVELNLKNGANESASFNGNPDLSYICCDEEQIEAIEFLLLDWNIPNCTVDANCTLNTDRFTLSDRLIISPNPVQHAFSIQTAEVILNVSVHDLNGRVIASYGANQTNSYPVNTANGVYLVKIITTDSIYTQKIVKH